MNYIYSLSTSIPRHFDYGNNIKHLELVQWDIIKVIAPSTCRGGAASTRAPHPQG